MAGALFVVRSWRRPHPRCQVRAEPLLTSTGDINDSGQQHPEVTGGDVQAAESRRRRPHQAELTRQMSAV